MGSRIRPDHDVSAYVYRHIRKDTNQVFYIGIGVGFYHQRAFATSKRNVFWHNVVAKTDWYAEIILDGLTRIQAEEKEKEFIALYKQCKDGGTLCNLTLGGDGSYGLRGENSPNFGKRHTPERVANMAKAAKAAVTQETRDKIRASRLGKPISDATKEKLRIALSGPKSPWYGKKRSPEDIQKNRLRNLGKKLSNQHKEKISIAQKGKKCSPETIEKMRQAAKRSWASRRFDSPL